MTMDPAVGFFGWLSSKNFVYIFFVMGMFCRVGTSTAYTYALFSYSTIVVTGVMLSEPLISEMIAIVMGLDNIPGVFTFIGMFITCIGLIVLSKSVGKEK